MPKLRDTDDLDVEALEAVEYSTERYSDYTGEIPPIGIELTGYVKRLWWTRTALKPGGGGDDPMLKVLWIADGNESDYEEYNGCPFWLNAPLVPGAKFRWDPFLLAYGLTLLEVKTKTYVAKEEDQNGFVIERIGTWKPGADRDEAWARIITGQELWNGSAQAIADEWIAWDAEEVPDGDGAEEPDGDGEEPELFEDEDGNLVNAEGELVDEDGNLVDEDGNLLEDGEDGEEPEPEPDPEPPARTRRAAPAARSAQPARATRSAQPARAARTASKPATAKTGSRSRSAPAKPAPARSARSTASPGRARAAKPAAAATPARSTRTKRRTTDNDPPF